MPNTKNVIILYADHPFVTTKTIEKLINSLYIHQVVLATVDVGDSAHWKSLFVHWGRIVKNKKGEVDRIVEYKDADENTRRVSIVNPGFYAFNVDILRLALEKVKPNNAQGEYYLTDVVKIVMDMGKTIGEVSIDPEDTFGINSKAELAYAESLI